MSQSSHLEIALASIKCFTDDGTLDIGELNYLIGLAMRDNIVDEDEKRVLANIFSKVTKPDVSTLVWERMNELKKMYEI